MAQRLPSSLEKISLLSRSLSNDVYLARRDGRTLVAKVPREQSATHRARLQSEYELLRRFDSPRIVRTLGLVEDSSGCALLLQWDESLRPLTQIGPLPLTAWLRVGIQAAESLHEVHAEGLIHKDVKPANLLASEDFERLVLLDFGHCGASVSERERDGDTAGFAGSPGYVAPEQTGRLGWGIDCRADLYSLGVLLFELMAGVRPFPGNDLLELAHAHIAKEPPVVTSPLFEVPKVIELIIRRLLAKSPDARYQTARGLRADLRRCVEGYDGQTIASFPLGQSDGGRAFRIPQALYGRQEEVDVLLSAYRDACEGQRRVVCVTGDSGVGKSKLLVTVRGVARIRAYAAGKADQFERSHPFSAIVSALGGWADAVSGSGDAQIEVLRDRLNDAVGAHGRLVVDLVPKLGWLLGEHPETPELEAEQAKVVQLKVLVRVLRSLASDGSPLILFLDDLQWADLATLELLRRLVLDENGASVCLLISYRDREVDGAHPLTKLLQDIAEAHDRLTKLHLGPLERSHVSEFVRDTLGGVDSPALVEHVFERSEGNPFYLAQMLTSFHDAEVIRIDPVTGLWHWDEAAARHLPPHDDVVDLLLTRFQRLSAPCRETLAVAAVLGVRFDVGTLAMACSRAPWAVGADLWPALEGGFLRSDLNSGNDKERLLDPQSVAEFELGFAHDRIQEAAKRLLGEKEAALRARLGCELVSQLSADALECRLFEVVDHCNFVGESESPQLRGRLAELNLRAARRARYSMATEAAVGYCGHGRRMLGPRRWTDHRALTFALTLLQAGCEYTLGHSGAAVQLLEEARDQRLSRQWQAETLLVEAIATNFLGDPDGSTEQFIEAMACLGLSVPRHPSVAYVAAEFAKTKWVLRGWTLEQLANLPPLTDSLAKLQVDVLTRSFPVVFNDKKLMAVISCQLVRLALRHGVVPRSAIGFAALGLMHCVAFGDATTGDFLGRVALALAADQPDALCEAKLQYGAFLSRWIPMAATERNQFLVEAYEVSLEVGELGHGAYALMHLTSVEFDTVRVLTRHEERCEAACAASERAGARNLRVTSYLLRRATCALGKEPLPTGEEIAVACAHAEIGLQAVHGLVALDLGLLFDCRELRASGFELAYESWASTQGSAVSIALVVSLCRHACRARPGDADRDRCRRFLRTNLKRLRRWMKKCPPAFEGLYRWVVGEWELNRGNAGAALDSLRRALELESEHPRRRGEILEAMAQAERSLGNEVQAKMLLSSACEVYRSWGAKAKVEQLTAQHGMPEERGHSSVPHDALATTGDSIQGSSLDLEAVFKSAQALSGEVVLEALLRKMIRTVLESTGGQRAAVLEPVEDRWELSVWGDASGDDAGAGLGLPDPATIPISVVGSVSRTKEPVRVSDATTHELWSDDLAVQTQGIRSILCVPVVRQRTLEAIVYVDHLSVVRCFPASRVRLLTMLASQISISLENARLYATLEKKVEERTAALREVSQDLYTILDHVQFGFLVVGRDLNVRAGFSRSCTALLQSQELAGRVVSQALGATEPREAHALEFSCQQIFDDVLPLELNREQFPSRLVRGGRVLNVEPSAVRNEGEVVAILLTIVDNTELEAAQQKNRTNQVLLNLLRRKDSFVMFLRDCLRLLEEAADAARLRDRDRVARCLHTLKGSVGLFGLFEVEQFIHELENKSAVEATDVFAIRAALEAFLARHREVLGVGLEATADPKVAVSHSALAQLDRLAGKLQRTDAEELRSWTSHARSPTVRDIVGPLVQSVADLAVRLRKDVQTVLCGEDVRIRDEQAEAVLRATIMLVRNSVDHGIEHPDERGNKPRRARIELSVSDDETGYEYVIADDGRGIDVETVSRKAVAAGIVSLADVERMTEQERLQLIFVEKLSTAKKLSTVSGRGVGMSALKDRVIAIGGQLLVESSLGEGTKITIRLPGAGATRLVA